MCKAEQTTISGITEKYKPIFANLQAEGESLKDSDDAKKFAVNLTWADTEIKFATPSVSVKDQRMIFGVPQVTMRTNNISFGTPSVRMNRVKTGQYPEFTCHDTWISLPFGGKTKGVPACATKWSNTYADIPESFMQEQHIRVDIPEFRFADTSIVMGIPEVFMQSQRIVVGVPQIKVSSVILDTKPLKDKADQLTAKASDVKTSEMQEMSSSIHALFECFRTSLSQKKKMTSDQFSTGLTQLDAIIQSLRTQGADPAKLATPDGIVDLVQKREDLARARDDALSKFDEALSKLDTSEKDAIDQIKA
jgi:hypothetical protein